VLKNERLKIAEQKQIEEDKVPVISDIPESAKRPWKIERLSETQWLLTGEKIEKFGRRTHFDNNSATQRLRDIMRKMGIMSELKKQKANPDDRIIIGAPEVGRISY
jgi:Obg family GTPase CgtA-like protein